VTSEYVLRLLTDKAVTLIIFTARCASA